MNEQRFRTLEPRALIEIGVPTAVFWFTLFLQSVLRAGLRLNLGFLGLDLYRYNAFLALGFTGVWVLAYVWTRTEVVISPKGLRLEVFGRPQWELVWPQLMTWSWDWHWTGVPQGILLISKTGVVPYKLRLGFLGLGRRVKGVVVPYLPYVPLLKALGYYLQGEPWQEPPLTIGKLRW